jgi:hypothetical protein
MPSKNSIKNAKNPKPMSPIVVLSVEPSVVLSQVSSSKKRKQVVEAETDGMAIDRLASSEETPPHTIILSLLLCMEANLLYLQYWLCYGLFVIELGCKRYMVYKYNIFILLLLII